MGIGDWGLGIGDWGLGTKQKKNKKKLGIEFISKVIYEINKILLEKGSNFSLDFNLDNNNKDDLLVEEIKLNLLIIDLYLLTFEKFL